MLSTELSDGALDEAADEARDGAIDEAVGEAIGDATGEPTLGARAARGALAVFLGQIGRILIQVVSVSILARLLDPADYGLVAIVLAVVAIGEIFRDFGLSTAAVQAPSVSPEQRSALFWCNTAIGLILTVLAIAAAPLVADLFGQPELVPIMRALAFTFLLNGMAAQHQADLNRHLRFGAIAAVNVGSQAIGAVAAIALAAASPGYWALVVQQLLAGVVTLVWLVSLTRWIPKRPRRGVSVRPFVRFGIGLVGSQVIGYLNNNVDTVTIGLRFSPTQLGYYNRGYQLLMRPLTQLRAPTTSVALPVLRMVGDDRRRADDFLVRGQRALGFTLVGGLAISAGVSQPLVLVLLGHRWTDAVPIFALMSVAGMFQTISYVGNWVYLARGLTGKLVWYSLVSLAIKIVCVLIGSVWGIVGVAAGFAIAPAMAWPISLWWLSRLTDMPTTRLYRGAARIVGCAVVAAAASFGTVRALADAGGVVQLLLGSASGVASYLVLGALVPAVRAELVDVAHVGRKAVKRH
ncbi:lipopolysaccharide biosynthesis protein [Jatrophihabitans fulvus]